jgi:5-methylcytosine-specific restriction enzyme subunit McrC
MTDAIVIKEQTEWCAALCDEDVQFLQSELKGQISVRQELREGRRLVVLNPNQYVGIIVLPSGLRLEIRPKVPVGNLFYMLSWAFEMPWPFRDEWAESQGFDDVLGIIAEMFHEVVDRRVRDGLYRTYVEQEENIACVRGRIAFMDDMRRNYLTRQRVYCRFAEFTWDVEENQVIRQVLHLLSGWGFRSSLRLKLSQLDSALSEITPTALAGTVITRFRYNRLNNDYRPIHQLCRLFLEGSSLTEQLGVWDSRTFLLDMNHLFEQFVTQLLISAARGGINIEPQFWLALGEGEKVRMRPDIFIRDRGLPVAVADCKYKRTDPEVYKNHDYYQVLSYCIAAGVPRGLLIYPLDEMVTNDNIQVRNTRISIDQLTINLGGPFQQFRRECRYFTEQVLSSAVQSQV